MGTEIAFIEWWTQEFVVWTLGKEVLWKRKNPHWNYDKVVKNESVDDFGVISTEDIEMIGNNHLPVPKMPYVFLSVFNLGDQPMDSTSLIQQNLVNQDLINKRNRQIDRNIDNMNTGIVISLANAGMTQSQAEGVQRALKAGGAVVIPGGRPSDAIDFPQIPSLSPDVYGQLFDIRTRTRDIFGTSGSTPAGVKQEDTVRGKIQVRRLDTDRIGGGVSEYLEQFADDVYNWYTQLLYVHDTNYEFLKGGKPPKLLISVKEGSLLPKDSLSIANQAMELASMGKMSNIDLYKRLEYPNPDELAANAWLETNAPHILYKENKQVQEAMQMQQQQAQAQLQAEQGQQAPQGQQAIQGQQSALQGMSDEEKASIGRSIGNSILQEQPITEAA